MEAMTTTNGNGKHMQGKVLEVVTGGGDLGKLTREEQAQYVVALCESVGLNPLSRPIELMTFQGRTVPYARKDCADQLRKIHRVSVKIVERQTDDGMFTVTARATMPDGREDEDVGAVVTGSLKGEALANAIMKAHTKAKRRVTLSICGLGILDETELDTMSGARRLDVPDAEYTVQIVQPTETRIADLLTATNDKIADFLHAIEAAPSLDDLKRIGQQVAKEPEAIKSAVRGAYNARTVALKSERVVGEEG
jgi:hypothetical protein